MRSQTKADCVVASETITRGSFYIKPCLPPTLTASESSNEQLSVSPAGVLPENLKQTTPSIVRTVKSNLSLATLVQSWKMKTTYWSISKTMVQLKLPEWTQAAVSAWPFLSRGSQIRKASTPPHWGTRASRIFLSRPVMRCDSPTVLQPQLCKRNNHHPRFSTLMGGQLEISS